MDWRIFYNPLVVLGKKKGFAAGLLIVIALALVAWWGGINLDGALDLHITHQPPSTSAIIVESLIAWLSVGIILLLASKAFGGHGEFLTHFGAAGLARFPYLIGAIIMSRQLLGGAMLDVAAFRNQNIPINSEELLSPAIALGGLLILGLIFWALVILYLGYMHASRLRGGRLIASFIIGILFAEAISKILLTRIAIF